MNSALFYEVQNSRLSLALRETLAGSYAPKVVAQAGVVVCRAGVLVDGQRYQMSNAPDELTVGGTLTVQNISRAANAVYAPVYGGGSVVITPGGGVTVLAPTPPPLWSLGGWTIDENKIYKANAHLSSYGYVAFGTPPPTAYGAYVGAWLGDSAGGKLSLYASATDYFQWDGSKLIFKAANTSLDASGNLTATSATISGAISGGTIDIGGADTTSFHVDAAGNVWIGAAAYNDAPLKITAAGHIIATVATISGAISASTIDIGGWDTTSFHVDVDGNIWSGAATYAYGPFRVSSAGDLVATSATITGVVTANTGYVGGATGWVIAAGKMTSTGIGLATAAGDATYAMWAGDNVSASAAFSVSHAGALKATSATVTGAINASSGTFTGLVQVGAGTPHIHIDGANALVESSNFAAGTSGWRIASDGSAEFENITARGFIKTAVFIKSLVLAFAGSQVTSKSASVLAADCTLSGTTFTVVVRLQAAAAPFQNGDLIYIKTESLATYATVNTGSASGANWSYTATYVSGSTSGTVYIGDTVIDYGPDGTGRVWITADDTYAPYISIATHAPTNPPTDMTPKWTERARLGLLTGISDASGYGLWTNNGFFAGAITASTIDIGGADTTSFHVDVAGNIWSGAAAYADGVFRVSNAGALVATSATISGAVTAATIDIGGADTTSFHVDINGNIWSGAAAYADGVFRVSSAGALVATSATISGAITAATIDIGGADTTSFHVDLNGNIWSGAAAYADGVFKVSNAGALVATSATITGAITASSGSLTGFLTLGASGGIYQGTYQTGHAGDAAYPETGLKIWNDSGVGRIAGYNTQVLQWYAGTDGKLYAGAGNVILQSSGISILTNTSEQTYSSLRWMSGNTRVTSIYSTYTDALNTFTIYAAPPSQGDSSELNILAGYGEDTAKVSIGTTNAGMVFQESASARSIVLNESGNDTDTRIEGDTDANLFFVDASTDKVGFGTNAPAEKVHVSGNLQYTGDLKPYRNSTAYTGYIFVPLTTPLTNSTYWSGQSYSTTSKTIIDLSGNPASTTGFGAPAGIKAALFNVGIRDSGAAGTDSCVILGPTNVSAVGIYATCLPANDCWGRYANIVPCDANGDIYYQISASGASTMDVYLEIWGYFI